MFDKLIANIVFELQQQGRERNLPPYSALGIAKNIIFLVELNIYRNKAVRTNVLLNMHVCDACNNGITIA